MKSRTLSIGIVMAVLLSASATGVAAGAETTDRAVFLGSRGTSGCEDEPYAAYAESHGVSMERGLRCTGQTTSSDPRFRGDHSVWLSVDEYADLSGPGDDSMAVHTIVYRLENEGGAWQGQWTQLIFEEESRDVSGNTVVLTGEDGYQGLTALVEFETATSPSSQLRGIIIDHSPPPPSDPSAAG